MNSDVMVLIQTMIDENRKLKEKKLLTPKELADMYGISIESQKQFRMRLKHPLPYIQIVENGSIKYSINRIDKWLENYEKNVA